MAEFAVRRSTQQDNRGNAAVLENEISRRRPGRLMRGRPRYSKLGLTALSLLCGSALLIGGPLAQQVHAQTTGNVNGLYGPGAILDVFGLPVFGDGFDTTPVNFDDSLYGFIKNPYIGVTLGYSGTFPTPSFSVANGHVTHNVAGMISFGNVAGSLLTNNDDVHGLNGLNTYEEWVGGGGNLNGLGNPVGWGVWPLASWWQEGSGIIIFDESAHLAALVDAGLTTTTTGGLGTGGGTTVTAGTLIPLVGASPATVLVEPQYISRLGILGVRYQLVAGTGKTYVNTASTTSLYGLPATTTPDFILDEYFELYRSTARVHWRLYNGDSVTHNITMRFTVPIRGSADFNTLGFYFVDPVLGLTNSTDVITGTNLPDLFTVYGQRVEDPSNSNTVPFAAKQVMRGYGATTPTQVWLSDPIDVLPNVATFQPTDSVNRHTTFESGIAESLYFGVYTLPPGATQDVYTFYGNGSPTEALNSDVVVGAEATESLTYNTAAATGASVAGNTQLISSATQIAAAQASFITPSPIPVKGSVYNRSFGNAQISQQLTNANLSLVLPTGLGFAPVPGSTTLDTATKTLGTVGADSDGQASWYLQATGATYGALAFQMAASSDQIGSRSVTRVINVPATPLHPVTNASFQMLGFPFLFDKAASNNSDPATIINKLAPTNLQDNPAIFYYWVPSLQSNGADAGHYAVATSISAGQGYFFRPASTRTIFAYGAYPYPNQAPATSSVIGGIATVPVYAANLQVTLQPGWNMITNPYLYPIPLSQLGFAPTGNGTLAPTTYNFNSAVSSGLIQGSVFYYDTTSGGYDFFDFQSDQATPTLEPWVGYWIFVTAQSLVGFPLPTDHNTYIEPDPTTGIEDPTRGEIATGHFKVKAPNMQNWTLQLVAKVQGSSVSDQAALIGVKNGVTTKTATIAKPPTPANNYVYIGLTKASDPKKYAAVYQAPGSASTTWNFEVTSDQSGPITVSWPNIATQPHQLQFQLTNLSTGAVSSLRSRSSIQVTAKAGQTTKFQLVASQGNSIGLKIDGVRAMRTGTKAQGNDGVDIMFNVSRSVSSISAQVMTFSGKVISNVIPTTRSASAGQTRLRWNGKNDNGASIPPGPYKIVVTVQDESGETASNFTPYLSLR